MIDLGRIAYGIREYLGDLHAAWIEGYGHDRDDVLGAEELARAEAEHEVAEPSCGCGDPHCDAGLDASVVYGPRAVFGPLDSPSVMFTGGTPGAGAVDPASDDPGGHSLAHDLQPQVILARLNRIEQRLDALDQLHELDPTT